jgi:hypothetical protein
MDKQEPRKLRIDLTPAEREQAERIGSLTYKSHRFPDMRVEQYPGIGPNGRAA